MWEGDILVLTLVCQAKVKTNNYKHWFQVHWFRLLVPGTKVKVKTEHIGFGYWFL